VSYGHSNFPQNLLSKLGGKDSITKDKLRKVIMENGEKEILVCDIPVVCCSSIFVICFV